MPRRLPKLVRADHPKINIRVEPSQGSEENRNRLEDGRADLALLQNDAAGAKHLRSVVPLYQEVLHFLVRRDSSIQRLADIRDRRIAVGRKGSGTERLFAALAEHHDLTYEDFEPQYTSANEAVTDLIAGKIQGMVFVAGLKSPARQRAIESDEVRFIGRQQTPTIGSEVEGFRLHYPFITSAVIPVRAYASAKLLDGGEPQQPLVTLGVLSMLACRDDVAPDVIRAVTQSIHQNRSKLIREFPIAAGLTENFDRAELQFALHPGADDYYRRADPSFLVSYAEPMAFILSVAITVIGGASAAKGWIERRKKNRIDRYFLRLLEIVDPLQSDLAWSQLKAMQEQLRKMQREAFRQLIKEDLKADESFRIFQDMIVQYERQGEHRLAVTEQSQV